MELSVRDWMIIVGVLLIVAVLLDGYRRMRSERRGNIRMSLNRSFLNSSDNVEGRAAEFPNGGARVVGDEKELPLYDLRTDAEPTIGDEDIDLNQTVPILMESVEDDSFDNTAPVEPEAALQEDIDELLMGSEEIPQSDFDRDEEIDRAEDVGGDIDEYVEKTVEAPLEVGASEQTQAVPEKSVTESDHPEVFVVNVAAKGEDFKGTDLLHILLACDLRFGDMDIFHRYENSAGTGAVQFSMANSVHPGTFDLDSIDDFSSPCVSFFMSVPGAENPMQAFNYMVETAQCLVKNLNGELRDESRSAMTLQTLEHCRQRIRDIERRQLMLNL